MPIEEILEAAFPGRSVVSRADLAGGMTNRNVLVRFADGSEPAVLRFYRDGAAVRAKEIGVLHAARGIVPVPEVLASGDNWMAYRYVDGVTFQELKKQGSAEHLAEAAYAIGFALAALRFVPPPGLVHGDFNNRNIIVRRINGEWTVAAILDWEHACVGSPLNDAARFICYENPSRPCREPHFSNGFRDGGGQLPEDWPRVARHLNAVNAAEALRRPDLPAAFIPELQELARGLSSAEASLF